MLRSLVALSGAAFFVAVVSCASSDAPPNNDPTSTGFGGTTSSSGGSGSNGSSGGGGGTTTKPSLVDVTTATFDDRSYLLAKPKTYDAKTAYPLVVSFHGSPGSAQDQARTLPFDSVSGDKAVILYPNARDPNDGWDLFTPTADNADMSFVMSLIDEVKKNVNVDPAKVFAFGFSSGSYFIAQLACRFDGLFRAITINAGGAPDEQQMGFERRPGSDCYICPGGKYATLVVHGGQDDPGSGTYAAQCFAEGNGCGDSLSKSDPSPCETYDGCPNRTPVKQCIVPDLGHGTWPDAMKVSWAFDQALP